MLFHVTRLGNAEDLVYPKKIYDIARVHKDYNEFWEYLRTNAKTLDSKDPTVTLTYYSDVPGELFGDSEVVFPNFFNVPEAEEFNHVF